jgi:hypothetical protein
MPSEKKTTLQLGSGINYIIVFLTWQIQPSTEPRFHQSIKVDEISCMLNPTLAVDLVARCPSKRSKLRGKDGTDLILTRECSLPCLLRPELSSIGGTTGTSLVPEIHRELTVPKLLSRNRQRRSYQWTWRDSQPQL